MGGSWTLPLVAVGLVLTGCGGGDEGAADAAAAADPAAARACLEEAGYEINDETALPAELREGLGIEDSFQVLVSGEEAGLGSVTYYRDESTAEEGLEAGRAVRTSEVQMGRVGAAAYDYAGGDAAADVADVIVDCLSP